MYYQMRSETSDIISNEGCITIVDCGTKVSLQGTTTAYEQFSSQHSRQPCPPVVIISKTELEGSYSNILYSMK